MTDENKSPFTEEEQTEEKKEKSSLDKFMVIVDKSKELAHITMENLGGSDFSPFDLEILRVPLEGKTKWIIPGLGKEKQVDKIQGIVLFWHDVRAWWDSDEPVDGNPPLCSSIDAKTGTGRPGGQCSTCEFAEFGSKEGGRGQACKSARRIFILTGEGYLPVFLPLPPTSLKNCRQYFTKLLNAGLGYWQVITEFKLEKAENKEKLDYSRVVMACAQENNELLVLPEGAAVKIYSYSVAIRESLLAKRVDVRDYVVKP